MRCNGCCFSPHREAQALHLLPYVDRARGDVEEQWREQVYNAAWNGHVLGYPSRFVASYCDDFPNDLPLEEKRRVFDQAKRNFAEHVRIQGVEAPAIRLGHDQPVDAEARKILFESL